MLRGAPVAGAAPEPPPRIAITGAQAVADGKTLNTAAIQALIDRLAGQGGGTVVVPRGVFVSGALFFKPRVNLHLEEGAVLQCSADLENFPVRRTRIEGHFEDAFNPALINASGCDGLRITGSGTLDGAGRPVWDRFWRERAAAKDKAGFRNLGIPRARLALIENSRDVVVDGVTFKDSQFWNLHLYRCRDVAVRNARFTVPDDYKQAPSSDGIDVDSSQDVLIERCLFSVTDDCVALKGTKGPEAREDKDSPPVERVRVRNCVFNRGHHGVALGSEATIVRDVEVADCTVSCAIPVLLCKLRPDTPQDYGKITVRNIAVDNPGATLLVIAPWTQYFDLKGHAPPKSAVGGIVIEGVKGRAKALAAIAPNPGQTRIRDITFREIDISAAGKPLEISPQVEDVKFERVTVNGKPLE